MKKIKRVALKIDDVGIIGFVYLLISMVVLKMESLLKIFALRLRGYDIDYSVTLEKGVHFYQEKKHSIRIESGAIISSQVKLMASKQGKIRIGKDVLIRDFSMISSKESIEIDEGAQIAAYCHIVDYNHKYPLSIYAARASRGDSFSTASVNIGKYVWIGSHVVILSGVTIGYNSVIGAGSIVNRDIASYSVAVGNPAKIVKKISEDNI